LIDRYGELESYYGCCCGYYYAELVKGYGHYLKARGIVVSVFLDAGVGVRREVVMVSFS
jgi:hypothetical protein